MVMRAMREYSKYIFWILAISFIGWLAYGQVLDILRPGGNAVLTVNGRGVSQQEFQLRLQQAYDQYRRQNALSPPPKHTPPPPQTPVSPPLAPAIPLPP